MTAPQQPPGFVDLTVREGTPLVRLLQGGKVKFDADGEIYWQFVHERAGSIPVVLFTANKLTEAPLDLYQIHFEKHAGTFSLIHKATGAVIFSARIRVTERWTTLLLRSNESLTLDMESEAIGVSKTRWIQHHTSTRSGEKHLLDVTEFNQTLRVAQSLMSSLPLFPGLKYILNDERLTCKLILRDLYPGDNDPLEDIRGLLPNVSFRQYNNWTEVAEQIKDTEQRILIARNYSLNVTMFIDKSSLVFDPPLSSKERSGLYIAQVSKTSTPREFDWQTVWVVEVQILDSELFGIPEQIAIGQVEWNLEDLQHKILLSEDQKSLQVISGETTMTLNDIQYGVEETEVAELAVTKSSYSNNTTIRWYLVPASPNATGNIFSASEESVARDPWQLVPRRLTMFRQHVDDMIEFVNSLQIHPVPGIRPLWKPVSSNRSLTITAEHIRDAINNSNGQLCFVAIEEDSSTFPDKFVLDSEFIPNQSPVSVYPTEYTAMQELVFLTEKNKRIPPYAPAGSFVDDITAVYTQNVDPPPKDLALESKEIVKAALSPFVSVINALGVPSAEKFHPLLVPCTTTRRIVQVSVIRVSQQKQLAQISEEIILYPDVVHLAPHTLNERLLSGDPSAVPPEDYEYVIKQAREKYPISEKSINLHPANYAWILPAAENRLRVYRWWNKTPSEIQAQIKRTDSVEVDYAELTLNIYKASGSETDGYWVDYNLQSPLQSPCVTISPGHSERGLLFYPNGKRMSLLWIKSILLARDFGFKIPTLFEVVKDILFTPGNAPLVYYLYQLHRDQEQQDFTLYTKFHDLRIWLRQEGHSPTETLFGILVSIEKKQRRIEKFVRSSQLLYRSAVYEFRNRLLQIFYPKLELLRGIIKRLLLSKTLLHPTVNQIESLVTLPAVIKEATKDEILFLKEFFLIPSREDELFSGQFDYGREVDEKGVDVFPRLERPPLTIAVPTVISRPHIIPVRPSVPSIPGATNLRTLDQGLVNFRNEKTELITKYFDTSRPDKQESYNNRGSLDTPPGNAGHFSILTNTVTFLWEYYVHVSKTPPTLEGINSLIPKTQLLDFALEALWLPEKGTFMESRFVVYDLQQALDARKQLLYRIKEIEKKTKVDLNDFKEVSKKLFAKVVNCVRLYQTTVLDIINTPNLSRVRDPTQIWTLKIQEVVSLISAEVSKRPLASDFENGFKQLEEEHKQFETAERKRRVFATGDYISLLKSLNGRVTRTVEKIKSLTKAYRQASFDQFKHVYDLVSRVEQTLIDTGVLLNDSHKEALRTTEKNIDIRSNDFQSSLNARLELVVENLKAKANVYEIQLKPWAEDYQRWFNTKIPSSLTSAPTEKSLIDTATADMHFEEISALRDGEMKIIIAYLESLYNAILLSAHTSAKQQEEIREARVKNHPEVNTPPDVAETPLEADPGVVPILDAMKFVEWSSVSVPEAFFGDTIFGKDQPFQILDVGGAGDCWFACLFAAKREEFSPFPSTMEDGVKAMRRKIADNAETMFRDNAIFKDSINDSIESSAFSWMNNLNDISQKTPPDYLLSYNGVSWTNGDKEKFNELVTSRKLIDIASEDWAQLVALRQKLGNILKGQPSVVEAILAGNELNSFNFWNSVLTEDTNETRFGKIVEFIKMMGIWAEDIISTISVWALECNVILVSQTSPPAKPKANISCAFIVNPDWNAVVLHYITLIHYQLVVYNEPTHQIYRWKSVATLPPVFRTNVRIACKKNLNISPQQIPDTFAPSESEFEAKIKRSEEQKVIFERINAERINTEMAEQLKREKSYNKPQNEDLSLKKLQVLCCLHYLLTGLHSVTISNDEDWKTALEESKQVINGNVPSNGKETEDKILRVWTGGIPFGSFIEFWSSLASFQPVLENCRKAAREISQKVQTIKGAVRALDEIAMGGNQWLEQYLSKYTGAVREEKKLKMTEIRTKIYALLDSSTTLGNIVRSFTSEVMDDSQAKKLFDKRYKQSMRDLLQKEFLLVYSDIRAFANVDQLGENPYTYARKRFESALSMVTSNTFARNELAVQLNNEQPNFVSSIISFLQDFFANKNDKDIPFSFSTHAIPDTLPPERDIHRTVDPRGTIVALDFFLGGDKAKEYWEPILDTDAPREFSNTRKADRAERKDRVLFQDPSELSRLGIRALANEFIQDTVKDLWEIKDKDWIQNFYLHLTKPNPLVELSVDDLAKMIEDVILSPGFKTLIYDMKVNTRTGFVNTASAGPPQWTLRGKEDIAGPNYKLYWPFTSAFTSATENGLNIVQMTQADVAWGDLLMTLTQNAFKIPPANISVTKPTEILSNALGIMKSWYNLSGEANPTKDLKASKIEFPGLGDPSKTISPSDWARIIVNILGGSVLKAGEYEGYQKELSDTILGRREIIPPSLCFDLDNYWIQEPSSHPIAKNFLNSQNTDRAKLLAQEAYFAASDSLGTVKEKVEKFVDNRPRMIYPMAVCYKVLELLHSQSVKKIKALTKDSVKTRTDITSQTAFSADWIRRIHRLCMGFINKFVLCSPENAALTWGQRGPELVFDRFSPQMIASVLNNTGFAFLPLRVINQSTIQEWSTLAFGKPDTRRLSESLFVQRTRALLVYSDSQSPDRGAGAPFTSDRWTRALILKDKGWMVSGPILEMLKEDDIHLKELSDGLFPNARKVGKFLNRDQVTLEKLVSAFTPFSSFIMETDPIIAWLDEWRKNPTSVVLEDSPPQIIQPSLPVMDGSISNDFFHERRKELDTIINKFRQVYSKVVTSLYDPPYDDIPYPTNMDSFLAALVTSLEEAAKKYNKPVDYVLVQNSLKLRFSEQKATLTKQSSDFSQRMNSAAVVLIPPWEDRKAILADTRDLIGHTKRTDFVNIWG